MVKALCVHTVGGRHRPQLEEVALPHPGCNEVEVRHTAIGLNYPDVEDCTGGGHHSRHSIFTPGSSAVGVITELGGEVSQWQSPFWGLPKAPRKASRRLTTSLRILQSW